MRACGGGSSQAFFEEVFRKHFTCRLAFFQYLEKEKHATERKEFASIEFTPLFRDEKTKGLQEFQLVKRFENLNPGQNFSFGLGLGVAILIEKTSEGTLELAADGRPSQAMVRIEGVDLQFMGKEINPDVSV